MMFLRQASSRTRRRYAAVAVPLSATAILLTSAALLAGCGSGNGTAPYNLNSSPTPLPTGFPTPLPTATPTPVPSGGLTPPFLGKVAFLSRRNASERSQVYVMNPDGSQVTELAPLTPPYVSSELQYPGNHFMSADGSKFLLTYDFGTGAGAVSYLVNADGTNKRDITALLEPNGNGVTSSQPLGSTSDVSMNANGSVLVFSARTFAFTNGVDASTVSLITMNADGSARTVRYTTAPGSDQGIGSPIFAPDGQTIYFLQSVQQEGVNGFSGNVGAIYRLAPGATAPTQIAQFSTSSSTGALVFPSLTINAAGTKLAFVGNMDSSSSEIFTVNTDGTGLTKLTSNTFVDKTPAFTTDGTKIIFASNRDGNSELYSMNPDGSGQTRLTYNIELDEEPATRASKTRSASKKAAR